MAQILMGHDILAKRAARFSKASLSKSAYPFNCYKSLTPVRKCRVTLADNRPEFRELRVFAVEEIPRILDEHEGTIDKTLLHRLVEEKFFHTREGWPQELDGNDAHDRRRATNAIAWALADLTLRQVIQPCRNSAFVRFRGHGEPLGSMQGAKKSLIGPR